MKFVLHTFRASETIDAVIRLKGRHSYTKAQMTVLRRAFDDLNGKIVPRPGMQYKIPLPMETVDEFGNLINTAPRFVELMDRADAALEAASATPGDADTPESMEVVDSVSESTVDAAAPPAPETETGPKPCS